MGFILMSWYKLRKNGYQYTYETSLQSLASSRLLRLAHRIVWATSGGCPKPVVLQYFRVLHKLVIKNVVKKYFNGFVNLGIISVITK